MDLSRISSLDLYFFSDLGRVVARDSKDLLAPFVQATLGDSWLATLERETDSFRATVERMLGELEETSAELRALQRVYADLSTWRRMAVAMAQRAPTDRREALQRSAGWGLGTPRSPKEARDVVLTLKSRMDLNRAAFAALGMRGEALDFPGLLLQRLEAQTAAVAREKAEDLGVRAAVRAGHAKLREFFTTLDNAARVAVDDRTLFGSPEEVQQAQATVARFETALGEARVRTHKRVAQGVVPAELVGDVEAPVAADPDEGDSDTDA